MTTTSNVKQRLNKQAKGFTKHYERNEAKGRVTISNPKHPQYDAIKAPLINTLIVRGTLDHLSGNKMFLIKKVKVEHPTDKGYFKEVYILTDSGKRLLKSRKRLKEMGLPFWEYMYKTDTL